MTDDPDFESTAVDARDDGPERATKDVVTPIHLSTTYGLDEAGYPDSGFTYARHGTPTRSVLQERYAALAGADHALATASGMAAIATLCLSVLGPGERIVAADSLYGGTTQFFDDFLAPWGVEVAYVDPTDPDAVAEAVNDETSLVWVESPTNPLLKVVDLRELGAIADEHDARLAVDNTFATPYAQRPLERGADVTVCSTTKFVNGHSDSVGGMVATSDDALAERVAFVLQKLLGAPLSPFDCYLVARGLKTLPARMEQHSRTAQALAEFLADHPAVATVNYPGLPDHPGHELAREQMDVFGGMVSFEVAGDGAETRAFVESLDVCNLAMSLGGVETLVEHTASMSGAALSADQRAEAGISDSLVRLSVGLESFEDLRADLDDSLSKV